MTFDPPRSIVAVPEGQEGRAQFLRDRERTAPAQGLLERADKPLGTSMALRCPVENRGVGRSQESPFGLDNIVLHDLDMEWVHHGHKFVRYADDFLVLVKSERAGQRVVASLTRFRKKRLRLSVNPRKSKVAKLDQCPFLGVTFRGQKNVWSEKSTARFQRRVKKLTGCRWGVVLAVLGRGS